jgi:hypothetical protein
MREWRISDGNEKSDGPPVLVFESVPSGRLPIRFPSMHLPCGCVSVAGVG